MTGNSAYIGSTIKRRKEWSYSGATARGDLGNRTYKLVVEITHLMREKLGYDRLYQISQLNDEAAGDVLETQDTLSRQNHRRRSRAAGDALSLQGTFFRCKRRSRAAGGSLMPKVASPRGRNTPTGIYFHLQVAFQG